MTLVTGFSKTKGSFCLVDQLFPVCFEGMVHRLEVAGRVSGCVLFCFGRPVHKKEATAGSFLCVPSPCDASESVLSPVKGFGVSSYGFYRSV